jgi:hypothetical protein
MMYGYSYHLTINTIVFAIMQAVVRFSNHLLS